MCFSAEASFGAAAGLAVIGVVSLRAAPTRAHLPLAAVPLLFSLQQASEGALWIVLERAPFHTADSAFARVFLFFALFAWLPYTAAALAFIERCRRRRAILQVLALTGLVFGGYLMAWTTLRASNACIAFDNIYYWVQFDGAFKPLTPWIYLSLIVGALLLSTVRYTTALAFVLAGSFIVVGAAYRVGFISVWCFFAAILSGLVALQLRFLRGHTSISSA